MAPEVINADKDDPLLRFCPKSDVFSIGVIFYFMLTGFIPYDGDSLSNILANNKKAIIEFDIPQLRASDPKAVDLLKRMLALNQEQRPSAEECLNHKFLKEDCDYMDSSGEQ